MSLQLLPTTPQSEQDPRVEYLQFPREPEFLMLSEAWDQGLLSDEELDDAYERLFRTGVPFLAMMS